MHRITRPYGVQALVPFGIYDPSTGAPVTDHTFVIGEATISKDFVAPVNTFAVPIKIASSDFYGIPIIASELQTSQTVLTIKRSQSTDFLQEFITIETYGNAAALHTTEAAAMTIITGTVLASPTPSSTSFGSSVLEATTQSDNALIGRLVTFVDGVLAGQQKRISAYVDTSGVVTTSTSFTTSPSAGDAFIIS